MARYFNNPKDLMAWVKSKKSPDKAANTLFQMIKVSANVDNEQDIVDTCKAIFEKNDDNAGNVLFTVLSKYNITTVKKAGEINMKKQSQTESRQRNGWVRGDRNKWNRIVDSSNENTQWRIKRDKYYDFTHNTIDAIKFDEDPSHVYSGEALWRTYIMDKFYSDYQDKDGHVVGGYINDRFHVFPTAGTPANPDAPRDGGNRMELAAGERSRKPRPHEWSTERRLEENRGNKFESIELKKASFNRTVKLASKANKEIQDNKVYSIFKDIMDMKEAGIEYGTILSSVAEHYNTSLYSVAQIDKFAKSMVKKHDGVYYVKEAQSDFQEMNSVADMSGSNVALNSPVEAYSSELGNVTLEVGTVVTNVGGNTFKVLDSLNTNLINKDVTIDNMQIGNHESTEKIQPAANELGLNA